MKFEEVSLLYQAMILTENVKTKEFLQRVINNLNEFEIRYEKDLTRFISSWCDCFLFFDDKEITVDYSEYYITQQSTTIPLPSRLTPIEHLIPNNILVYLDECIEKFGWRITKGEKWTYVSDGTGDLIFMINKGMYSICFYIFYSFLEPTDKPRMIPFYKVLLKP